ncbi:MAG: 50S ribosomal protein L2 [Patescibacteria group bacterium]|nr:50S ribosomal protein L2 [Patescibacteria group bacterium]MBU1876967.1 50S ribosomal protein L2 [Patescibacteria group bacterium]
MKQTTHSRKILSKKEPEKRLLLRLKENAGRSSSGRISVRHHGSGVKKLYRIVDFGQEKIGVAACLLAIEYDPNRTAFLMLLEYSDGDKRYQLAPHGIKIGENVICDEQADAKIGNRMRLENIPSGTRVYNIELIPNNKGKIVRSAGTSALILAKEGKYCNLEMPSKEIRKIPLKCFASIGQVSRPEKRFEKIATAGAKRRMGWRPTNRGSSMNPCDHPHGGGEGKTPIGLRYPKTPWGKPARGVHTRRRKSTQKYIIKRRSAKKRK